MSSPEIIFGLEPYKAYSVLLDTANLLLKSTQLFYFHPLDPYIARASGLHCCFLSPWDK
jgi:hypothetical protein